MKKTILYMLCLLTVAAFYSCKDDDLSSGADNRLFRTMFRCDNNTGKGNDDPYNCTVVDLNDVHLYWYNVDGAAGYHIKWALQSDVSGGRTAWEKADSLGTIIGDTIIPAGQTDMVLKDLNYQTNYYFAIQTLHSMDLNDPQNSDWYGYGDGRQWADYLNLQTDARYPVPTIIQTSNITKTSMRINLDRSVKPYTDEEMTGFREHFHDDGTNFKVDYLTITPSKSSPDAVVPAKYQHYELTSEDWSKGYVDVEGLSENSVYNIDAWDSSIPVKVDANYNALMKRTKGTPGPPILIKHVANTTDTLGKGTDNERVFDISKYNSMSLDNILNAYCSGNDLAENQVFYLEGGKAYHTSSNISIYKGLTLKTNPADIAAGKGKATLYLGGLTTEGTNVNTNNFMIGRQPQAGENASIPIDIDSVRFQDLNVDVPLARNYGHQIEGIGSASGNYFMNMYSNGMGINVNLLEWDNCTFNNIVRGFFRVQGSNDFVIHHIKIENCEFFNDGYYGNKAGGYNIIHADLNKKPNSNILENVDIKNNTFYDVQIGNLITDANRNNIWGSNVRWNIDVENNSFINFDTRSACAIFNLRYMPGGSTLTFKKNFISITKDAADANRTLFCMGCDIRNIQGGDGSGNCTFDFADNWSTNNDLTGTQIFTSGAFNAKKNAPGKWLKTSSFPSGVDELAVHVDNISATELMVAPNPTHHIGETPNHLDHHADNLNGLYFQNSDKVKSSEIYKRGIGASKWREKLGGVGAKHRVRIPWRY